MQDRPKRLPFVLSIALSLAVAPVGAAGDKKKGAAAAHDCSALKAEIAKAESDLAGLRKGSRSLRDELAAAKRDRDQFAAKLAAAEKRGGDLGGELSDLRKRYEAELVKLKTALSQIEAKHAQTAKSAAEAMELKAELKKENQTLTQELQAAWGRAKKADAQSEALTVLEKEKLELISTLKLVREETKQLLHREVTALEQEIRKRDELLTKTAAEFKAVQTELAGTRADLKKAKERPAPDTKKLDAQLAAKGKEIVELKAELEAAEKQLANEGAAKADCEKAVAALRAKLAKATAAKASPAPKPKPAPKAKPVCQSSDLVAVLHFANGACCTKRDREIAIAKVREVLQRDRGAQFDIIGHTCNTGCAQLNLCLSKCRAQSVHDLLVIAGIKPRILDTYGLGEEEPVADNRTERGRRANRRVEIRIYRPGALPPGY